MMSEKTPDGSGRKVKRKPTLTEAFIPIAGMAILLGVGYGGFQLSVEMLLIAASCVAGFTALRLGYTWKDIESGAIDSIAKAMPAQMIIIVVGIMIASWIACGSIPMLIDYGLGLVSPSLFLVTACLVCGIISLLTGTAYGTAGTVGIAFIGIAQGMGIPLGAAAGAIVAGSYLGDKISPFAASVNLASAAAGCNVIDTIQHLLWTTLPAYLIGMVVYWIAGTQFAVHTVSIQKIELIQQTLQSSFTYHWLLLLPPVIVLVLTFMRKPAIPGMLLSSAVALILAAGFQKTSIVTGLEYCVSGYKASTKMVEVNQLLSRGGLQEMMKISLVAFCAFAFAGIVQKAGMLDLLLEKILRFARTNALLIASGVAAALTTALVTGSAYLSVLIPGELFSPAFKAKKLAAKNLARATQEAHSIVPVIPWAIAGVYMTGTLGVSTWSYAPWAVFNYIGFLVPLLYAWIGFTTAPLKRDDETLAGS
jgi:Na+:H+ antiporter, NhaC family